MTGVDFHLTYRKYRLNHIDQGSWYRDYESYRTPDVKEEKNPAAGPGRMSLSLPTWLSESMDPHLDVFSPNLLPT